MDDLKKKYLTNAVRRYRSLFTFPGYRALVTLIPLISILGSILAFMTLYPPLESVYKGAVYGIQVLIVPTLVMDVTSAWFITRKDAIFNLKRTAALSLVSCVIWLVILVVGGLFQRTFTTVNLLGFASVFGACMAIVFRFLVLISVSQLEPWRAGLTILLQPAGCLLSTLAFWNLWTPTIFLVVIASTAILMVSTLIFISLVNRHGELAVGIGAIALFKGFLANWIGNLNVPLEGYFEKLGSVTDVSVALLNFGDKESLKTIVVIPGIHPGPFRSLGSSNLPYMIQKSFEEKFGVTTIVPHGASGHELDLTSQLQCEKVIKEILALADSSVEDSRATRLVREEVGLGKATCQLFGDVALVTVTCAPRSMEDVPREIELEIRRMGEELGVKAVVVIDAHNSIGSINEVPVLSEEELEALRQAAQKAIGHAMKERRETFSIGVARVLPVEFGVAQGIGPCGIMALVTVVAGQKAAYVTIDGNNMVSGLREDIIQSLRDVIDDCEVLTTDTHAVNAVSSIDRGYHPVGEVIDHDKLISYIRQTVSQAIGNVETSWASYKQVDVHDVKVIGEEKLLNLTKLVDSTFKLMARTAPLIFIPAFIISLLPFILLL